VLAFHLIFDHQRDVGISFASPTAVVCPSERGDSSRRDYTSTPDLVYHSHSHWKRVLWLLLRNDGLCRARVGT